MSALTLALPARTLDRSVRASGWLIVWTILWAKPWLQLGVQRSCRMALPPFALLPSFGRTPTLHVTTFCQGADARRQKLRSSQPEEIRNAAQVFQLDAAFPIDDFTNPRVTVATPDGKRCRFQAPMVKEGPDVLCE